LVVCRTILETLPLTTHWELGLKNCQHQQGIFI
jgi:hypothetical protein